MTRQTQALTLAAFLTLGSPGLGAERSVEGPNPAADVSVSGNQLVVEPRTHGVATSVTVACADGTYVHEEFEGAGAVLVDLAHDRSPLTKAACNYEVRIHPPVDHQALNLAAERGDVATLERLTALEREQTVVVRGRIAVDDGVVRIIAEADAESYSEMSPR